MLADGWLAITAEPDGKGDKRCQRGLCNVWVSVSLCVRGEDEGSSFTHNIIIFGLDRTHLSTCGDEIFIWAIQTHTLSNTHINSIIWRMKGGAFANKQVKYSLKPPQQTSWDINSKQQPNILQLSSAGKQG